MQQRISKTIAATAIATTLLLRGTALAGPLPELACEAAKNKAAGKYATCRHGAEAKLATNGDELRYIDVLAKCGNKFATAWQKAIDKASSAGATCLDDPLTASDFQALINAHTDNVAKSLSGAGLQSCVPAARLKTGQTICYATSSSAPAGTTIGCPNTGQDGDLQRGIVRGLSYTDNVVAGTITDNITGLMWERLIDDGSIHDKDNAYTWADAFTKVATLNSTNFAGYNDWRLPNINELQTLANYGVSSPSPSVPAVDPAFNTNCGQFTPCSVTPCSCTRPALYWSSTTYRNLPPATPARAWTVSFALGGVDGDAKNASNYVRAVRDSCLAAARPLKTGQTTCYTTDTSGNSMACLNTGQDGELQKGIVRSYTDNVDGTITDNSTGLVWEKLTNVGPASIHDKDTAYNWAEAFAKVATLNSTNFAGHNDWRLPNINELQSLANYGVSSLSPVTAAVDLAFRTSCPGGCPTTINPCSCTAVAGLGFYWSSTTYRPGSTSAWGVAFTSGDVHSGSKGTAAGPRDAVRAVRGGCST